MWKFLQLVFLFDLLIFRCCLPCLQSISSTYFPSFLSHQRFSPTFQCCRLFQILFCWDRLFFYARALIRHQSYLFKAWADKPVDWVPQLFCSQSQPQTEPVSGDSLHHFSSLFLLVPQSLPSAFCCLTEQSLVKIIPELSAISDLDNFPYTISPFFQIISSSFHVKCLFPQIFSTSVRSSSITHQFLAWGRSRKILVTLSFSWLRFLWTELLF